MGHWHVELPRDVKRDCLVPECEPLLRSNPNSVHPHCKALGHSAMAHMYSTQAYNRIPPAGPSRRHPFSNAVNMNQPPAPPPKAPEKEQLKQSAEPPLPRQNSKIAPPSPPKVIIDKTGRFHLHRVGFLGEVSSLLFLCVIYFY